MRRVLIALAVLVAGAIGAPARAEGVDVGKPSSMRNLVPAGAIEKQAVQEYEQLNPCLTSTKKTLVTSVGWRVLVFEAPTCS